MEDDSKPKTGLQRLKRISERRSKVDIVGNLIGRFDFTVRQIFSYLDFSSLKNAGNVCKTWNEYLMELWMEKLRKTEPFLEYLDKLPSIHYTRPTVRKWSNTRKRLEWSRREFDYEQNMSAASENSDTTEISDPTLPWKNLFDIVEQHGSIELMIDLSKEIECIAILNKYMNIDDEIELQMFRNVGKIFEDAYTDERFRKELVEFDNDMVGQYDFSSKTGDLRPKWGDYCWLLWKTRKEIVKLQLGNELLNPEMYEYTSKTFFFRNRQKGFVEDLRQELGGSKDFTPSFNKQFEKSVVEDVDWNLDQFEDDD